MSSPSLAFPDPTIPEAETEEAYELGFAMGFKEGIQSMIASARDNTPSPFTHFLKKAEEGDLAAQLICGNVYFNALDVDEGEEGGDSSVTTILGLPNNTHAKLAAYWTNKSLWQGYTDAYNSMGFYYQNGLGVEQNEPAAIELYTVAAGAGGDGAPVAAYNLGDLYEKGSGGETPDKTKALEWYKKAAALGDDAASAKVKELSR